MTRVDHASGTDRIAEANRTVGAEQVINVQADEPLVSADQIRLLAELIGGPADMATLATRFTLGRRLPQPQPGQGRLRRRGARPLFFKVADPLPPRSWRRPDEGWVAAHPCYKHLGFYAYKAPFLEEFAELPAGTLEGIERLEQLRAIENGREIAVGITEDPTIGVETPRTRQNSRPTWARGRPERALGSRVRIRSCPPCGPRPSGRSRRRGDRRRWAPAPPPGGTGRRTRGGPCGADPRPCCRSG